MDENRPVMDRKYAAEGDRELSIPDSLPEASTDRSAAIAGILQKAIEEGAYVHGERLPPERILAEHYRVSRSTVREALRRLTELKLLARRVGSGTYVTYQSVPDSETMAQRTSPLELVDVRLAIEPQMIRLATVNCTSEDLEQVEKALEKLENVGSDKEAFSIADEEFHLQLAVSTRNPLMLWIYAHINDVRSHTAWHKMRDKILSASLIQTYNAQHRQIFEAISSRDSDAASKIVRKHLETARKDLLGADNQ